MGEVRRRRPWLAVLLALVISGLGHAYLRRWGRALGWYVAITITLVVLVPDAAVDQLFAGTAPPVGDLLPALVVILASVIDAYVLAVRNNREYERRNQGLDRRTDHDRDAPTEGDDPDGTWSADAPASSSTTTGAVDLEPDTGADPGAEAGTKLAPVECPNCGRETDPEIDFCHWCTEPLPASNDSESS